VSGTVDATLDDKTGATGAAGTGGATSSVSGANGSGYVDQYMNGLTGAQGFIPRAAQGIWNYARGAFTPADPSNSYNSYDSGSLLEKLQSAKKADPIAWMHKDASAEALAKLTPEQRERAQDYGKMYAAHNDVTRRENNMQNAVQLGLGSLQAIKEGWQKRSNPYLASQGFDMSEQAMPRNGSDEQRAGVQAYNKRMTGTEHKFANTLRGLSSVALPMIGNFFGGPVGAGVGMLASEFVLNPIISKASNMIKRFQARQDQAAAEKKVRIANEATHQKNLSTIDSVLDRKNLQGD